MTNKVRFSCGTCAHKNDCEETVAKKEPLTQHEIIDLVKQFDKHDINWANVNMASSIAATITSKRISLNMSQREFGKLLGVSQKMVHEYESGCYNFSVNKMCEIFKKLNIFPLLRFVDLEKEELL